MKTAEELLQELVEKGGCIVSSRDCHSIEITDAQVTKRMYIDKNGLGYIRRPKEWLERIHKQDGYMQPPNEQTK